MVRAVNLARSNGSIRQAWRMDPYFDSSYVVTRKNGDGKIFRTEGHDLSKIDSVILSKIKKGFTVVL